MEEVYSIWAAMELTSLLMVLAITLNLISPVIASSTENQPTTPSSPEGWVGRNIDDLTALWGEPDQVFTSGDESRIVIYLAGRKVVLAYDPHDSLSRSPKTFTLKAHSEFKTDPNGLILEHNGRAVTKEWNPESEANQIIRQGIVIGTLIFFGLILVMGGLFIGHSSIA